MANTKSAQKMVRKIAKRTAQNTVYRTRMRSKIRKVREAIEKGEKTEAVEALRLAQPEIMKNGSRGIIHAKTASRKVSRLAKQVATLN